MYSGGDELELASYGQSRCQRKGVPFTVCEFTDVRRHRVRQLYGYRITVTVTVPSRPKEIRGQCGLRYNHIPSIPVWIRLCKYIVMERNNHNFDGSVCAPMNKICPNDGTPTPVGCENKLAPALMGLNGGSVPAADPTPVPGVMTDARNGFAAPRPTPKPVACGCSPTPIEEPPPSVVNPLIPVLAVGELVGCLEGPKLPPRPAPVLTPVVGDDTPLRPELRPVAPLVPIPTPVVGDVTPLRPAPRPTPAGALTPVVPVVPVGDDTTVEAASSAGVVGSDSGI